MSFFDSLRRFLVLKNISPFKRVFFSGNKPMIAKEVTDFPEPDSPTTPRISFLLICREIP